MADIHPVKYVYDSNTGAVVALSEYQVGDTIPTQYLNLNVNLEGGCITDRFKNVIEHVDGGLISDNYHPDAVAWDGGTL